MEAIYQDLNRSQNESISFLGVKLPHFVVPWHYHPDIEILLILKGEGRRFVGDHIENFYPGDLCVIGSDLPHVWQNNDIHKEDSSLVAECMVIHFRKEMFGEAFWQIPEMQKVNSFLKRAARGVSFDGKTRSLLEQKIKENFEKPPEDRLIVLLELLNIMTKSDESTCLSSSAMANQVQSADGDRFQKIVKFVALNFHHPVRLEDAASQIHMSPTAFCRYFKDRTRQSFLQYLNNYRIGYARRLLIENKMKIQDIAFDCGFNNLSHFNLQFKKISGTTPRNYRNEHVKTHYQIKE